MGHLHQLGLAHLLRRSQRVPISQRKVTMRVVLSMSQPHTHQATSAQKTAAKPVNHRMEESAAEAEEETAPEESTP
jgi:hypothetical protein